MHPAFIGDSAFIRSFIFMVYKLTKNIWEHSSSLQWHDIWVRLDHGKW